MKFWLSFADSAKPEGEQFLGVCIVEATDLHNALETAWRLSINPGGEVVSQELPSDTVIHESWMYTLLDRATIESQGRRPSRWAAPRVLS